MSWKNGEGEKKIAVLIDAENISRKYIRVLIEEVTKYGIPTYKRVYGDWTNPQMAKWKEVLLNSSITPIQQYAYTTGKNSTDSSLIIDAMDILYSNTVDGFCICSSDSDFTRLAARLRESGMFVLGMGEAKTSKNFIAACERFVKLEFLLNQHITESKKVSGVQPAPPAEYPKEAEPKGEEHDVHTLEQLRVVIQKIITELSDDEGYLYIAELGNALTRRYPEFDTRNYGFTKLRSLLDVFKEFEIKVVRTQNSNVVHPYIRIKEGN